MHHPERQWKLVLKGDVSHLRSDPDAHGSGKYYNWNFGIDTPGRKNVDWYH